MPRRAVMGLALKGTRGHFHENHVTKQLHGHGMCAIVASRVL